MGRRTIRGEMGTIARTEALRSLRSSLLVAVADLDRPVVTVTSARRAEGRTSVCAGLAESLVSAGHKVALIDLDLRHPQLHQRLGATGTRGVVDVLAGACPLGDAIKVVSGFAFLGAGQTTTSPTEVLGDPALGRLLRELAADVDIVLVDSAPVLAVADTLVLARVTSGAVLVVEAGSTPETAILAARDALTRAQVHLFGVALNKIDGREWPRGDGSRFGLPWRRGSNQTLA